MANEQTISNLKKLKSFHNGSYGADIDRAIKALEQEPKTGHWIAVENEEMETIGYYCSECDLPMETENQTRFCPNCGARMVEPQETETWNGYHGQITAPKGTFEKIYEDAESEG